jgi:amino acid adenylation domain-containing protein
LESIGHPTGVLDGAQPGGPVECEQRADTVVAMDNRAENGLSARTNASSSAQACRTLPETATAALRNYIGVQALSLDAVVAACWSELVRCYAGADCSLSFRFARYTALPAGVRDVLLPQPAVSDTVRAWLLNTAKRVAESAQMPPDAVLSNQVCEGEALASKLSCAILVVGDVQNAAAQRCELLADDQECIEVWDGHTLELRATFNDVEFSAAFREALLACLAHMLTQLPSLDGQPVSKLELTPPSLYLPQRLLSSGASAAKDVACIHEAISKQSQRAPEQTAVISGEEQITYGELNYRANQLARYLIAHGAAPDSLVAVHLKRSVDLLVALVGVLKSGAAFLPLDVSLPAGRIAAILKASESPIVLTASHLAPSLGNSNAREILIDAEREAWQNESGEDFPSPSRINHLAYVTYTSGSTGTPKGVMIEHRNVMASFQSMDGILGTTPGVWLASTTISFDIAVTELLWTLARGFRIVIHEGDEGVPVVSGTQSVAADIRRYGVTHFQGTPTLARMVLTDPAAPPAFATLKKLLLGGEPFPPSLASTLLPIMTGDFYNVYGPTETTVCATFHAIRRLQDPLPIGKPLGNTLVYVLDQHGRILPPLAPGELFIGGPTVGRGYCRRPDLTAERFVSDPFSGIEGGRLYRTGDLVRVALDGNLEFIDRLDSQVKIRGYRIELGEIEAVLRAFPAIEDAVVVVRGEASAEKTLAGFFTLRPGARASLDEITAYLKQLLPSYMVPPSLAVLESLPLSSNGKTDRAKLAATAPCSAPRSKNVATADPQPNPKLQEIERSLCTWCSEVLKVPDVTPTMDFFEIGGQSLAAAELVHRIAKRYHTHIRLSTLIRVRTMRGLAELASRDAHAPAEESSWSTVVEVRGAGAKAPLFLIAGLGGNVVNFELLSRAFTDDRPIYAIETRGTNRNFEILETIEDMAGAYLEEVRRIQPSGPYYLCGYSFGGVIAFEMARQLREAGHELGMVGLIDTSEWHYTERVMNSYNFITRLQIIHSGAMKRLLFGPDRRDALRRRVRAASAKCRVTIDRLRGRHLDPAMADPRERNLHALRQYTPKYYSGDLHLFRCTDPALDRGTDPLLGWGDLARRIIVSEIPGLHGSLTVEPYVGFLAKALHQALDSLDTRATRNTHASRAVRSGEVSERLVPSV